MSEAKTRNFTRGTIFILAVILTLITFDVVKTYVKRVVQPVLGTGQPIRSFEASTPASISGIWRKDDDEVIIIKSKGDISEETKNSIDKIYSLYSFLTIESPYPGEDSNYCFYNFKLDDGVLIIYLQRKTRINKYCPEGTFLKVDSLHN